MLLSHPLNVRYKEFSYLWKWSSLRFLAWTIKSDVIAQLQQINFNEDKLLEEMSLLKEKLTQELQSRERWWISLNVQQVDRLAL